MRTNISFTSNCQQDTERLARQLAAHLKPSDVLFLEGDLGTGKSVFARAVIQSYCPNIRDVPSPTFTLVQEYPSHKGPIYHFDLYRLEHPEEVWELGFQEALNGICLIEWPERLGPSLIMPAATIHFTVGATTQERFISFSLYQPHLGTFLKDVPVGD